MSSNVLFPEFWANEILLQLYTKSAMLPLVHKDFSAVVAEKGEVVHAIRPDVATVEPVNTAAFDSEDANPSQVNVTLSNWVQTKPKAITDKVMSMSYVDLVSLYMEPMAQGLVKYIEADLLAVAAGFTNHLTGIPTTVETFAGLKKQFDIQLAPDGNRNAVLCPDAEVKYQGLYGVFNVAGAQGVDTQTSGLLGVKHGIGFYGSTLVDTADNNMAAACFHKNSIALISRPPREIPFAPAGSQATVAFKGLGIRVSFVYDGKAKTTYVTADILYGTQKLDDRLGFRVNKA